LTRVTAILLTYNCAQFVGDALRSVLHQRFNGSLEVIVSDDASADGTPQRLRDALRGAPSQYPVRLLQRSVNSGSKSAHLNDVFPRCSGEILVSFDADDMSEPDRIVKLVAAFERQANVQAVYSAYSLLDAAGRPQGISRVPHPPADMDPARWFARVDAYAAGATLAIRRDVVNRFGPLQPSIHEDIVLPFRASLLGRVVFLPEPLVRVRRHADSLTADHDRYRSIEAYRRRMLLGIERARQHCASRLADLDRAATLFPDRSATHDELRAVATRSLAAAESSAGLLDPQFGARAATLMRLTLSSAYREHWLQHAALALAPGAYLAYKRRSLQIRDG
jgi:glycosyltransferase involved in cell wall biosynthesis